MKRTLILSIAMLLCFAVQVNAATIQPYKSYRAKVESVAVGFYGQVGIQLEGFDNPIVLLNSNYYHLEILDLFMTAKKTDEIVNVHCYGGHFQPYKRAIVVTEASLGDWDIWTKSN